TTHFLVTVVVAAVLWRVSRERFRRFRARVVTLAFTAIAFFAVYPTVPPWMAGREHLIPTVRRIPLRVSHHLGIQPVATIFEHGSHFANSVAAVPSLHAAFPMLLLIFFWSSGWPARTLLGAYVLTMGLVVVYSGEHYVFDVLAGWAFAAGTAAGLEGLARARRRIGPRIRRRALAPVLERIEA
ncbi:MAG: phosphatase PAP2 family protein, partial [Thermoleophilaceae bacterium]